MSFCSGWITLSYSVGNSYINKSVIVFLVTIKWSRGLFSVLQCYIWFSILRRITRVCSLRHKCLNIGCISYYCSLCYWQFDHFHSVGNGGTGAEFLSKWRYLLYLCQLRPSVKGHTLPQLQVCVPESTLASTTVITCCCSLFFMLIFTARREPFFRVLLQNKLLFNILSSPWNLCYCDEEKNAYPTDSNPSILYCPSQYY